MGATSEAHTAAAGAMTTPSSRTRAHRPAESALAETGIAPGAEAAVAASPSRVGLPREDARLVPALQLGLEADSDPPGRSISLVEGAAQGAVGRASVGHIDP